MFGAKCLTIILCLSLCLTGATFSSSSSGVARFDAAAAGLIAQGELIEAPADATAFVSIGGIGSLLLASGAKIRLATLHESAAGGGSHPMIFLLGSSGGQSLGALGALATTSAKVFTDSTGIASVNFTAGANPVSGTISATVEGTNAQWVGQISLLKTVPGFWSPQNIAPMAVMAGTVAVSVSAVKSATKDGTPPVQASGGPVIKP